MAKKNSFKRSCPCSANSTTFCTDTWSICGSMARSYSNKLCKGNNHNMNGLTESCTEIENE